MNDLTDSERLAYEMELLAERMATYDEGCIVAGRNVGLQKDRASHVYNKLKIKMGEQAQ